MRETEVLKEFRQRTVIFKRPIQIILLVKNWMAFFSDYLGWAKRKTVVYNLRNGVKFLVRTGSKDKSMILEIWADKCYTPPGFEIQEHDLIVDIGSNIGAFSIFASGYAKKGTVYSIEPVTENFELLERNSKLNKITNIVLIRKAITESSGERQIFVQLGDTTMHSFYNPKGESKKTTVNTLSLNNFMELYKIEKIDFLKMDCEGSEYEILFGTPEKTLRKIKKISMESHPLDEKRNLDSMEKYLEQKGFKVSSNRKIGILYASKD